MLLTEDMPKSVVDSTTSELCSNEIKDFEVSVNDLTKGTIKVNVKAVDIASAMEAAKNILKYESNSHVSVKQLLLG